MGAYGSVHTQDFLWTQGEELLSLYQQKETTTRKFCSKCGSYLITTHSADPDNLFISLGALDSLIDSAPEFRQFVGSKAVGINMRISFRSTMKGLIGAKHF